MTFSRSAATAAAALAAILIAPAAAGQDALTRAKALYTSAAYDEALTLLNEVDGSSGDFVEAHQYRAFCLLALGRSDDAKKVIQQIVEANPTFQPSETQVSPRLQDAFRDVRKRLLPTIVRQSYADAKGAFERKEFELAGTRFENVIGLLGDKDAAGVSELNDLRILSQGFLDLIKTLPPPAPPQPAAAPTPEPPPAPRPAPSVYDANDSDITPPVAISQAMPPWHPAKRETQTYEGTLIIVIDEHGEVTSVTSQGSLHPAYSQVLRLAAKQWKFRPATRNGVPVPYRKIVAVRLSPSE